MDTSGEKLTSKKSIALVIGALALLLIAGSLSAYFLYVLPQQKADSLALEQRKLDIAEKGEQDDLALEMAKHEAAVEAEREKSQAEKEKSQKELEIKQAELNRELEADCQEQIGLLRLRFNNIEGGGYNTILDYCEVTFLDKNGEVLRGDVKGMVTQPRSEIDVFVLEDDGTEPVQKYPPYMRYKEPVEFKGTLSTNCDQVVVTAENSSFEKPDIVLLQKYNAGDPTFVYHAKKQFNNLDMGINNYEFKATCDGKTISKNVTVYLLDSDMRW